MKTKKKPSPTPRQLANKSMREYIKQTAIKAIASDKQEAAKQSVLAYAKANTNLKDEDGNIEMRGGYVHFGKKSVITPCDGFIFSEFVKDFPELVDKKFKVAPMKALLEDESGRERLLQNHCVELIKEDTLEIIIDKKN